MSSTLFPTCPAHSPTPVNNEEEVNLQAFLVAVKCKAQEKWEKLWAARLSGVVEKVVDEGKIIKGKEIVEQTGNTAGYKQIIEKDVEDVPEKVEWMVVPKTELPSKKRITRMIPHSREIISIPKKRGIVVDPEVVELSEKRRKVAPVAIIVDSDSESTPFPVPLQVLCL
ncbi:hypothetical protein GGU10DRAFT_381683 [Lentinula aff. detonsa]|uniref:Uncharacterized protein n=1 Tax=Lentinula aff. detonsa TaxID=2804958 RepID=A0AA38NB06_9AGAR|nr:hypothetical protein GGU10DRAFT_381683 [Lentinula aff. detonsa]